MPAPLSVIISTHQGEADLPLCLESLMVGLDIGLIREVIVVDAEENESVRQVASAMGAHLVQASHQADWGAAGATQARGEWFLFLPSAAVLSRDWAERADIHMLERPRSAAFFKFKLRSDAREARRLEMKANSHARKAGRPLPEQGLLISRELYEGTLRQGAANWLAADVAAQFGKAQLVELDAEARASASHYEADGWKDDRLSTALFEPIMRLLRFNR